MGDENNPMPPVLRGERVVLRPAEERDAARFAALLGEAEVARWFGGPSAARHAAEWARSAEGVVFAIEVDGEVAGAIQYWEETDPDYRHAGMDIFLGEAHQRRGLGPEALALLARHLFEERGHHRLVIDPAVANERAARAYERVGFRRVGVMRR
jgi:aminoglycoside 6'-N-acetyltransferase